MRERQLTLSFNPKPNPILILTPAATVELLFFGRQRRVDRIQPTVVLVGAILADRLFDLDLLQLVVESMEILFDHVGEFRRLQRMLPSLFDALDEECEFLAQRIRANRMAELDLVAIVESLGLFGQRFRAAAVRMLALGEVLQQAGGRLRMGSWSAEMVSG